MDKLLQTLDLNRRLIFCNVAFYFVGTFLRCHLCACVDTKHETKPNLRGSWPQEVEMNCKMWNTRFTQSNTNYN